MKPEYIYMNVVAPSFIMVPIITAITRYRSLSREGNILFVYLIVDMIVSILSSILAYHHLRNTPLYHIATIVDTVILLYFFYSIFQNRLFSKYLKGMMVIFPLAGILNILFIQHIFEFNSYMLSFKSILIIILCFLYWWHYESETLRPWTELPLHWIISGLMLYFSSAFILFTFSNLITSVASRNISLILWNIHASLSLIMYLMLAIGISKYKI